MIKKIDHLGIAVKSIEDAISRFIEKKGEGIRLIDEKPRLGARGAKIAFIHPKDTKGVLIELCER